MTVMRRSRWLARLAGGSGLALGLAGLTVLSASTPAQARAGAVLIQSHVAASWGDNSTGQLGDGLTTGALRSDGIVFAWGLNGSGQLGNGTTTESSKPVKIAGLSQVTGIAAGWDSAVAIESSSISALTSVWTWGANDQGQLGDGTLADHSTPERVTGIPASVRGVSAGVKYAVVLGADGSVWGWGENVTGELGVAREDSAVTKAGERDRGRQRHHPAERRRRSRARAEVGRHRAGLGLQ